jgi:predicted metal-binding protein
MTKGDKVKSFDFLKKQALESGAVAAKIIPVEKIVIEDRIVFKCTLGCEKYGKTLACPPYAPSPSEFRKIVGEYHCALFMKFKTHVEADAELRTCLTKTNDLTIPREMKVRVENFWAAWNEEMKKLRAIVIMLEKAAAAKGFLLAAGLVSGSCQVCEKCNVEEGICVHPEKRRFSEEAVGVNVKATAEKAGVKFTLPFRKSPETFALLLID